MSRRLKHKNHHSFIRRGWCPTPTLAFSPRYLLFGLSIIGGTGVIASSIGTSVFSLSADGNVRLDTEVATAIAMKIASPNDTNPECMAQSGVTYGEANRYATSNGAEGSKQVDTFDGTEGGADEINTNTSCAKTIMTPNTYTSTYSDVTVYTNSPSGYAISLQTAEPNLVNVADNTKYIPAGTLIEQDGTGEQAGQKVVPGGQNAWAYKTDNGIITSWTAASSTDTTIKSYDQETNNGEATRVTYGVSAGATPTGTYATNLTYTATIFDGDNPHVSKITIPTVSNLTTSTESLNIPFGHSASVTVTPASGYYLSGVTCPTGFTCSGYVTDKSNAASAAAQTITLVNGNTNNTGTLTLAVTKLADYMQDFSAAAHSSDATGTTYTLSDSRDETEYQARKLADGKIWMIQNLKLVGPKTLTSADSNVSTSFNLTASNSGTWCTSDNSSCDDQSMVLNSGNATYGTYYNWYAATAGTGTYSMGSGQQATASICPKGWRLPTNTEFQTLYNNYSSTSSMQSASGPALVLSGGRYGGSTRNQGSGGYYWSSVARNSSYAYYLSLNSSNVYPQDYDVKYYGLTVRCVAAS